MKINIDILLFIHETNTQIIPWTVSPAPQHSSAARLRLFSAPCPPSRLSYWHVYAYGKKKRHIYIFSYICKYISGLYMYIIINGYAYMI